VGPKKPCGLRIAIGEDADLDVLQRFIGHPEIKPLQANNSEALVNYIRWVSTAVLKSGLVTSQPDSRLGLAGVECCASDPPNSGLAQPPTCGEFQPSRLQPA